MSDSLIEAITHLTEARATYLVQLQAATLATRDLLRTLNAGQAEYKAAAQAVGAWSGIALKGLPSPAQAIRDGLVLPSGEEAQIEACADQLPDAGKMVETEAEMGVGRLRLHAAGGEAAAE